MDRDVEDAARTDGADRWTVFRYITWPLASAFLLEGLVLTWARALGEFGATILFAGSLQGRTRTITLAIYSALESDLAPALVLSAVMVLVAFTVLAVVRRLGSLHTPAEPGRPAHPARLSGRRSKGLQSGRRKATPDAQPRVPVGTVDRCSATDTDSD
ncbi:molybdate ABC transporter permease subunit [Deinococcus radiopugnans]|uniref:molybdate ABC transporter permease subunit n=1 Tax=Deinococcus radiopugnans TaxID=57497 RepID=UPI0036079076